MVYGMHSGNFRVLEFSVIGLVAGIWFFATSFKKLRLRRAVENTPRSAVGATAMGKCEVRGVTGPAGAAMVGPLSGLKCVWYRWMVQELQQSGRNARWVTLKDEQSFEAFLLSDETGQVRVEPRGAGVEPGEPLVYENSEFHHAVDAMATMGVMAGPLALEWMGSGGMFSRPRRLTEWTLAPNQEVLVLGVLRSLQGADGAPVKVLSRGLNNEPFFISIHDKDELDKELFWSVWVRMIGGALLAVAAAALGASALLN
ncbi:MAG TPA: GIDE domain-containing protein [bacterium]|nr:GIDE domain-containing protein [bacterium]